MNFLQINPYEINSFKKDPRTRATAQQIYKVFGPVHLDFLHWFEPDARDRPMDRHYDYLSHYQPDKCPRENYLISSSNRFFNISIFYYIEFLKQLNPTQIVDIGCANNILKKVCNNIYGFSDDVNDTADEHEAFGPIFVKKHANQFHCAMAICSLHFISLLDFEQRILDFSSTISPGGRGLVTFNVIRMVENTSHGHLMQLFQTITPTKQQLAEYTDQVVRNISLNFLVVDNVVAKVSNEGINGNIRLVFEK